MNICMCGETRQHKIVYYWSEIKGKVGFGTVGGKYKFVYVYKYTCAVPLLFHLVIVLCLCECVYMQRREGTSTSNSYSLGSLFVFASECGSSKET